MDAEAVARLRRVIAKLSRLLNASAASEGLTPTQASVLGLVATRGPIGLAELVELEGLNPTMLSRVVAKLHGAGLIRRLPDPNDQRAAQVEATPAGRRRHERIRDTRTRVVARALDDLPEQATQAILDALPALEALTKGLRATTR